ncbi:zinc finger protein ZFP2-like [Eupeodes corollae]|uniref:zinc finger protein ZFP2-like n=1 Tax=Eupeodes corollae TaxID=290404 RepID=UPI00249361E1|nr:zinc finger protein ZFP2-like [Eupeodes corollae]
MSLEISSENSIFVEKTCRACCRFDPDNSMTFHPIFDYGENGEPEANCEFIDIFNDFFLWNLEIKPNDGLPQQMCTECLDKFCKVNTFRKQVFDSQNILLSYISRDISEIENTYTQNITEEDQLSNIDKIGYISPSKLIEYVGYEEEEEFFNTESQNHCVQADNCEENESDYLFNHPNQIDARKNIHNTIVVVNTNEINNKTNSEGFEDKSAIPLVTKDLPNRNELETENNATFQCDVCMKFIPSLSKLKLHTRQFHVRKDYVCSICNTKLEQITQRKYYNHMNTHRSKEHKCSYCDKAFIQKIHLINHERIHTKEQPFECDECGKKYRQEITLQEHKLTHKDPFPWKCEICGKGLKGRSCLMAHMRGHSDGYQCEVCGVKYTNKQCLKNHMLKHTEHGEKIYQCKFCFKSFRRPFQLGNHFHTHHLDNSIVQGFYRCTECNLQFETASNLIEHRRSHEPVDRIFTCESCGKCFTKKTDLKVHVEKVHLKNNSFSCIHCHKSFFDLSDMNAHLKVHNNQDCAQYKCNECEKVFPSMKSLHSHQISHSNDNRFKCTFCEESFRYRNDLGEHVLSHFLDEKEDSIVKEVQKYKHFETYNEEEMELESDYQLLDSILEEY